MTASFHPNLEILITRAKDVIADCKRKVALLGTGHDELIQAEKDLIKTMDFVSKIDNLLSEDRRFKLTSVKRDPFISELNSMPGQPYKKLDELKKMIDGTQYDREKIRIFIPQSYWIFLILMGLAIAVIFLVVNFIVSPSNLVFWRNMSLAGLASALLALFSVVASEIIPLLAADVIDAAKVKALQADYDGLARSCEDYALVKFNREWFVDSIPLSLFYGCDASVEISCSKGKLESKTRKISEPVEGVADSLVSRLVLILTNTEIPHEKWQVCSYSKDYNLNDCSLSHLPNTKSLISNLVHEYAYVSLSLNYDYQILFCVSNVPIEFCKKEEIFDVKPIAGYTIDEIREYLTYAKYAERKEGV